MRDNRTITFKELLENDTIKQNIEKMKEEYVTEPLTTFREKYKKLEINYYRDSLYGTWTGVISVPVHSFVYEIKTKNGTKKKELYTPSKLILQTFPEVTHVVRSSPTKPAEFGVVSQGLSPTITEKQLTTLYECFNPSKNTHEQKIKMLENIHYVSLKEIKRTLHKIVDFIIDKTTPQNFKEVKCEYCGKIFKRSNHYKYKDKIVCGNCYKALKNNKFADLSKIHNGEFYTKRIGNKRYFACHKCGLLCTNLANHFKQKHHLTTQQYEELYDIDYKIQYEQVRKYIDKRNVNLKFKDKDGKECNIYARGYKPEYYGRYDTKSKTTIKTTKNKTRQSPRLGEYTKYKNRQKTSFKVDESKKL